MRDAARRRKDDEEARDGLMISSEYVECKMFCRARRLNINGNQEVLVERLISDCLTIIGKAWLVRRLSTESLARGLDVDIKPWNLVDTKNADPNDDDEVASAKGRV